MTMDELKHLRPGKTAYPRRLDPTLLDTFPNPRPGRPYTVRFESEEVTSLCPVTGQPDFYRVEISYVPAGRCLESKSLKLYLFSFRDTGLFAEDLANRMLDDLVRASAPAWLRVRCRMNPRGGIALEVEAEHGVPPAAGSQIRACAQIRQSSGQEELEASNAASPEQEPAKDTAK